MADERNDVYFDDEVGKWVYRASGFGGCIKNLVMQRRGYTGERNVPDHMQRAFDDGSRLENEVIDRGCKLVGAVRWRDESQLRTWGNVGVDGQLELEIKVGKCLVRVHPDFIATIPPFPPIEGAVNYVGEAKALGKDLYKRLGEDINAMPLYAWQVSIEAAACGLPIMYVMGLKGDSDDGVKDIEEVKVKFIDPPFSKGDIIRRVMLIERLAEDEGDVECDVKQWPCGFYKLHEGSGVWKEVEDESEKLGEDRVRVAELQARYLALKKYEGELKGVKEELLKVYLERGVSKAMNGTLVVQAKKGGIDVKKMEADGLEVEKYRGEGYTVRYVQVKQPKNAKAEGDA